MHFGKRLERDLVERWRPHYLQYKLLKKHIKEMEEHLRAENNATSTVVSSKDEANGLLANQQISYQEFSFPGPKAHRFSMLSSFKPILDKEVEKINVFTTSKVAELQNRILLLLRTSPPWKTPVSGRLSIDEVNAGELFLEQQLIEANTIAQELVDIDKFIRQNCIAIQKIIKKFDKRLQFDVAPWLNAQLMETEPFLKVNLDALLIAVSDAFEKLNAMRSDFHVAKTGETKEESAKKKGISAQTFERRTTKYWVRSENLMAVKVAILKNLPIYMFDRKSNDGPSRETFKTRNYLRDFGDLYGDISDSSPITSIYLDNDNMDSYRTRLTREEGAQLFRLRWYGDAKSLPDKEYVFVERKTHHESWVLAKSVKERFPIKTKNVQALLEGKFQPADSMKKWMKPDSKGLKLIKNEDELQKAIQLSNESFQTIQKKKLRSMVRTLYRRAAFQARDHNEVRISIDTNLMMVNEDITPSPGNEYPWCRDMVHSAIPPSDILQFPYCILEVKLNCDTPPAWIANLLADTNTIFECHKFSKFLTGIAYHQYKKITELPHWFKDQIAIDPRNRFLSNEEKEKLIYKDSAVRFADKDDVKTIPASSNFELEKNTDPVPISEHRAIEMPISADRNDDESQLVHERTPLLNDGGSSATINTRASSSGLFSTLRNRILGGSGGGGDGDGSSSGSGKKKEALKPIRSADRIKIEPKTSFANERTLIQWVSSASLMITLSTLIMTSGSDLGFKAGFVFFPLAFVIMLYAIVRYQYRAWSFRHRRNSFQDDLYGPVFLVIAIASAMGVIMFLMFRYNSPLPKKFPRIDVEDGCQQLPTATLEPYFAFSDIALVGQDLVAVGPFAYATLKAGQDEWKMTEMPDKQLVSVISLNWGSDMLLGVEKPQMQLYHATKKVAIDMSEMKKIYNMTVKAMAPIGDNLVLIPGESGSLYKVKLNFPARPDANGSVNVVSMIPCTRIASGLIDEAFYTHISGLWNDETKGRLYVLFGKARRLRVFDSKSFKMLNEWYLPGTSLQWSGVSISHEADGHTYAFMSQSIPSEIWKFRLTPEANELKASTGNGFTSCAEVYDGDLSELMSQNSNDKFRRSRPSYVAEF